MFSLGKHDNSSIFARGLVYNARNAIARQGTAQQPAITAVQAHLIMIEVQTNTHLSKEKKELMVVSVAHLGPQGTHTETAAIAYVNQLKAERGQQAVLRPYPNIAQTLQALANGLVDLAVVPVENSVEGGVSMTLDTLWQIDRLQIQHALVLPIAHALISCATSLANIRTVYSHPQALAQCQKWLLQFLPQVQLVPTNATTEALQHLEKDKTAGAIASTRSAQLYNLPVLSCPINDYPDNYTRFWVLSLQPSSGGSHTSFAFSVPANVAGAVAKPLSCFATRNINLSRIESRPTKRSLGEYLFFIDVEADVKQASVQSALEELATFTETLKIFGSYSITEVSLPDQIKSRVHLNDAGSLRSESYAARQGR